MAKNGSFTVSGYEALGAALKKLGHDKAYCEKAVNDASPILLQEVKKSVRKSIYGTPRKDGGHHSTGGLENSFINGKAKTNKCGTWAVIAPTGYDTSKRKKVHYGARAAFLEYGTSVSAKARDKNKQAPAPFRKRAVENARERCIRVMEDTIVDEVEKIWG